MKKINVKYEGLTPTQEAWGVNRIVVTNRVCDMCHMKFYFGKDSQGYIYGSEPKPRTKSEGDNGYCSTCQFWASNALSDRSREYAIVNGEHYVIGNQLQDYVVCSSDSLESILKGFKSPGQSQGKGMGGTKYALKVNNRIVITDDLWGQGTIPEYLRKFEAFKNNAEILAVA